MENIFLKLLNMSITASWLVLAVVVLRLLLKKAPKWINTVLWAFVGFRLVCPFSFESIFSLIPSTETVPADIVYSSSPAIHSGIPALNSTLNPIISRAFAPDVTYSANPLQIITAVAAVIWIIGIVAMILYAIISFLRLNKKVREGVVLKDNIWICDRIDTPFILGLVRPRIFLPSDMSESDMEYVIAHETVHLKRNDHWWKPVGFLLLTVYWFNPVIWLAYILLCRDIELACDEKVIKKMGTDIKKSYSEALINCSVTRRTISACPLAFGETGVKGRIKSVLSYKKPTLWIIIVAVISCIVVAVCFLTNPISDINENNTDSEFFDYTKVADEVRNEYIITAIHYPSKGAVEASILIGEAHGTDVASFLDNVRWRRSTAPLESLSSPGSVEFVIDDDYRVTIYERKKGSLFAYAIVKVKDEERYYHASYNDYMAALATVHAPSDIREIKNEGFYSYSYITEKDSAYLSINPELKTAFFSLSRLSSYVVDGIYEDYPEKIVVTANDNEHKYTFRKSGDNLVFDAEYSTAVPKYRYDGADKEETVCIPHGALFKANGLQKTYIDKVYADIDNDGIKEDCIMGYGPTSGLFTVTFTVYEKGRLEYFNIFNISYQDLWFETDENGKAFIRCKGVDYKTQEEIITDYEIGINDGNVRISSEDKEFAYWGEQGIDSHYAPAKQ